MPQQFACFGNHRGVAVECRISFAGSLSGGIMLRRHIGNGEPLGFAVYTKKRLVTGIGQFQKSISTFLNRRFRGRECKRREREKEHQPSQSYGLAGEQEREKCSAMHGRSLTAFARSCVV